jgi:hypothetical protein
MDHRARTANKLVSTLVAAGLPAAVAVIVLVLNPAPAMAWGPPPVPCDFMTGGGYIIYKGAHANFGVGGGCKDGSPTWGHLEYIDHGNGLNVHWTSITGYLFANDPGDPVTDPKTGQPLGTRVICGTARTNLYGDVNFIVRAKDAGEPGINDQFDIALKDPTTGAIKYDTLDECRFHFLGSSCSPGNGGGGNIQLHKPNPSTTGDFGGFCDLR